jgi:DNA ligase-1
MDLLHSSSSSGSGSDDNEGVRWIPAPAVKKHAAPKKPRPLERKKLATTSSKRERPDHDISAPSKKGQLDTLHKRQRPKKRGKAHSKRCRSETTIFSGHAFLIMGCNSRRHDVFSRNLVRKGGQVVHAVTASQRLHIVVAADLGLNGFEALKRKFELNKVESATTVFHNDQWLAECLKHSALQPDSYEAYMLPEDRQNKELDAPLQEEEPTPARRSKGDTDSEDEAGVVLEENGGGGAAMSSTPRLVKQKRSRENRKPWLSGEDPFAQRGAGRNIGPHKVPLMSSTNYWTAHNAQNEPKVDDPSGWYLSEKLDGMRALWDPNVVSLKTTSPTQGRAGIFISRQGYELQPPEWFTRPLSTISRRERLDGELYIGVQEFNRTCESCHTEPKSPNFDAAWREVRYCVFDVPSAAMMPYTQRQEMLKSMVAEANVPHIVAVEQTLVPGARDEARGYVLRELDRVEARGGEGLMLAKPYASYEFTRSENLVKIKRHIEAEARVVATHQGNGKNAHWIGSLELELPPCAMPGVPPKGRRFFCGVGLSDEDRNQPQGFWVGNIVSFRFKCISTVDHKPREPTFIRCRGDAIWPPEDWPALPVGGGS